MIPLLLIALQAEPAVPMPPPAGGRFSILARDPCPASRGTAADIIVCGRRQADDRAPQLRDEPPTGPVPSNPELTGAGLWRPPPRRVRHGKEGVRWGSIWSRPR